MAGRDPYGRGRARPTEPDPPPQYPAQFNIVEKIVEQKLGEQEVWPVAPIKLELESADIYQDVSGVCLAELNDRGKIEFAKFDGHKYIVDPDTSSPSPDIDVKEATNRFYHFFDEQQNAFFAELAAYTALSRVFMELSSSIPIDAHPKGNFPRKMHGKDIELDGLLELGQERFPIEVYNGFQFVDDEHRKLGRMEKHTIKEIPLCNSVFINRLSSPYSKEDAPKNGRIIDTEFVIACEENNPQLPEAVELLNIDSHFAFLPKIETDGGQELDGNDWTGTPEYSKVKPSKVSDAYDNIPEEYMRSIRGGIQFQHVSMKYRNMSGPVDKAAATVVQDCYHDLLRKDSGREMDNIIDDGWEWYEENYGRAKTSNSRFEPEIKQRSEDILLELIDEDIIIRRSGNLYARNADHPHTSFNF